MLGPCEPLIPAFSSTDQHLTVLGVCFCLKTPNPTRTWHTSSSTWTPNHQPWDSHWVSCIFSTWHISAFLCLGPYTAPQLCACMGAHFTRKITSIQPKNMALRRPWNGDYTIWAETRRWWHGPVPSQWGPCLWDGPDDHANVDLGVANKVNSHKESVNNEIGSSTFHLSSILSLYIYAQTYIHIYISFVHKFLKYNCMYFAHYVFFKLNIMWSSFSMLLSCLQLHSIPPCPMCSFLLLGNKLSQA